MNRLPNPINRQDVFTNPAGEANGGGEPPLLRRLIVIWLAVTVILLPVKIINLPSNFELVDIWILMGLPLLLVMYTAGRRPKINLTYGIPIWLVMVSSLLSTFASPEATNSLIVMLKEGYLFTWFLTITALLSMLTPGELRRVLIVWSSVAIFHGLLILAQFFSPALWSFTNALGGNTVEYAIYRPAGLFICDHAGCANKAAFFQLLGFVPLILAGMSARKTMVFGIIMFASMLVTGSMGATVALMAGALVGVIVIAIIKKNLMAMIANLLRFVFVVLLIGGGFYAVISQSPRYSEHFERIIVGRFDKSSGSRFNLWGRGINVLLDHNAFLWGVGPENFRELDPAQTDNQLHNDTLAFLVERGLIGLTGLALFAGIGLTRAISILLLAIKMPDRARLEVIVFLAVIISTVVESLTHQIFRTRELWLILAIQEALYFGMKNIQKDKLTEPVEANSGMVLTVPKAIPATARRPVQKAAR